MLHQHEIKQYEQIISQQQKVGFVASRWAVKEAAVKSIGKKELIFNEMKVTYNQEGQPLLNLSSKFNKDLLKSLGVKEIVISYTVQS